MGPAMFTLLVSLAWLGLGSAHVHHNPQPQQGGGSGQVTKAPATHGGGHGTGGHATGDHATGGHATGGHGGGTHFDYSSHGQNWKNEFYLCSGRNQSPVNLKKYSDFSIHTQFGFEGFDKINSRWTLTNNGHSAKVTPDSSSRMGVYGGGLADYYVVDQFHFHWPSEHTVSHMHYPMEMHVVMHNSKYGDLKSAMSHNDGLAVLGVFFEVRYQNQNFDDLIQHLTMVRNPGATTSFHPNEPLSALLPYDRKTFKRYHGSLTTPPCSEAVIWTVFSDTVKISESQLQSFKYSLLDSHNNILRDNFRNTQPLNGRYVQVNH